MFFDINLPVVVVNRKHCHYKLNCKCLAIPLAILALTVYIIFYWTSPFNKNSRNQTSSETWNSERVNKIIISTPTKEVYYFDGAIQQASVTIDNSLAAFFYYRLNTHVEDWKCQTIHRIESRPGSFDVIFFCEDLSPELDCIMYSFGINYWWGNEEQFRDRYNCNVYSFDPSMTNLTDGYIRNVKPRIDFMRVGLSNIDTNIPDPIHRDTSAVFGGAAGKSRAWIMLRFSTILKMLNQTNKLIDMVAIDSEGAEYGFLEDILETGVWKNIKQLCIEYHFFPGSDRFFIRHARALNQFRRLGTKVFAFNLLSESNKI